MYGDVPIIVVTADGRAEAKARRVGARTYLQKPFNLDDLIDSVRSNLYA
jgi:CheY-like chemotaxis protein